MERANSESKNGGVVKLPIGFRFHPTDEELVVHYLKRKVFSLPLPASVIPESEVFQFNPWDLPGDLKEKRHFFSQKKMNLLNKCSSNFITDCGYWKASNKDRQILAPASNLVIGLKKSYVFYRGNKSRGLKTQWIMHEFCLVGSMTTPYSTQKIKMQVGDWVACRVYQRKRKSRNHHGTVNQLANGKKSQDLEFPLAQTSSSWCSSGITEISSSDLDQEATSSSPQY